MLGVMEAPEFGKLFETFRASAFRLETVPEHRVAEEAKAFAAFLEGRPLPPAREREWLGFVASSRAAGKTVERVHLVGGELTPYLRFEWGYAYSAEAGEEIFLLEHPDPQRLFGDLPVHDSWLFDDAVVDANDLHPIGCGTDTVHNFRDGPRFVVDWNENRD